MGGNAIGKGLRNGERQGGGHGRERRRSRETKEIGNQTACEVETISGQSRRKRDGREVEI